MDMIVTNSLNAKRLKDVRDRLLHVCSCREVEVNKLTDEVSSPGSSTEDQWSSLKGVSLRVRALAADCMALEQRVGFRAERATSLCAVADRLVEEFSSRVGEPRSHYVLVSEAEHFGADASAIHLGYARLDVWNLNRAAHEFGHLWAEEFANASGGAQREFVFSLNKESVDKASAKKKWGITPAKEFFADIVATVLTGPAYAYSCLCLDFSPLDRKSSDDSHPCGDERAYCILIALKLLATKIHGGTGPQMEQLTQELDQHWSASRIAAGAGGLPMNLGDLELAIEEALERLAGDIPGSMYKDLSLANAVKIALRREPSERPTGASCIDVLNGAWLRRRDQPDEAVAIGERALAMMCV